MIGVDIVDLNRINLKESLVHKILTEKEYKEYSLMKLDKRKIEYLGGRFAAKEAIFKASQDPNYLSYTILNLENGQPYVEGHPEIEISISHDGNYAIALVFIHSL